MCIIYVDITKYYMDGKEGGGDGEFKPLTLFAKNISLHRWFHVHIVYSTDRVSTAHQVQIILRDHCLHCPPFYKQ